MGAGGQRRPLTIAGHVNGLDGIRAFAVLAVILSHAATAQFPGGFYGVDVFFCLSGFLITSLLLAEWERRGTISLRQFWLRRARRLLPALFVLLAVIGIVAAAWPTVLGTPQLLADGLFTLAYSANWHFALEHTNYFSTFSNPSPLGHTWSLGIEEQFYLVWPITLLGILAIGKPRRGFLARRREGVRPREDRLAPRRLLAVLLLSVAGAAASAIEMAILAPPAGGDPSRVYYGTDTRAQALLVGTALAAAMAYFGPARSRRGRFAASAGATVALAGLVLVWVLVPESAPLAFHGAFLLAALATAALIYAAVGVPQAPVARLLSARPLRYIGRISYGMYLWYLPTLLVLSAQRTHMRGPLLVATQIGVIMGIASISFHFVETPVRRGALSGWREIVGAPAAAGFAVAAIAVSTITSGAAPVIAGSAGHRNRPAVTSATLRVPEVDVAGVGMLPSLPWSVRPPSSELRSPFPDRAHLQALPAPHARAAPPVRMLLVGDSMAGSLSVGLTLIAKRYDVEVINRGGGGCSLASDQAERVLWYTVPPGPPCVPDRPDALLSRMRAWVREFDPDVVVYLARSETLDTEVSGSWQHLGEPAFDRWVQRRLGQAVQVLGSEGAKVVFLTSPYYDSGRQGNGQPWPENNPARVVVDGALMTAVARADPGKVSVVDFTKLTAPSGHYTAAVDGVDLRCGDGVHITPQGGEWIGARLLPWIAALGRSHADAVGPRPLLAPAPPPSWYGELPCG